jgi:hypothetical protein
LRVVDANGQPLKEFNTMSRARGSKGEWTSIYFLAASQKEAEAIHKDMTQWGYYRQMDYKLERIREKE